MMEGAMNFRDLASRGSSKAWNDAEGARLCQVVIDSNNAAQEGVANGKIEMLDILSLAELNEPDDMGLTLPYLAVYYDRPEILTYLFKRGMDLNLPCDPMKFGTPLFYAVSMRRVRIIEKLQKLGVSLTGHCDELKQLPVDHARRIDDEGLENFIIYQANSRSRALTLFTKNILRYYYSKWYKRIRKVLVPRIQKRMRGVLGRKRVVALRRQIEEDEEAAAVAAAEEENNKKKKKKKKKVKEEKKEETGAEIDADDQGDEDD